MPNTKGDLVPAEIHEVDSSGKRKGGGIQVRCMFNPFEYTVSKSNTWEAKSQNNSDVPKVEFKKAGAQTLKLNLIFDTYETGDDISKTTVDLWKLMETKTRQGGGSQEKMWPPEVAFLWGSFRFVAVITSMTQKFTMFKDDGTPVRAKVDVTFTQHVDLQDYAHQNPTSGGGDIQRSWRVVANDRLDMIAYKVYGEAGKWKKIAEFNGIDNPTALRPGQTLTIPRLD